MMIAIGGNKTLTATVDSPVRSVVWSSSNADFTVDPNGTVTAPDVSYAGDSTVIKATITDAYGNEYYGFCSVGCYDATPYITEATTGVVLSVGATHQLELEEIFLWSTIEWSSATPAQVAVDEDTGLVTAVASTGESSVAVTVTVNIDGADLADTVDITVVATEKEIFVDGAATSVTATNL